MVIIMKFIPKYRRSIPKSVKVMVLSHQTVTVHCSLGIQESLSTNYVFNLDTSNSLIYNYALFTRRILKEMPLQKSLHTKVRKIW